MATTKKKLSVRETRQNEMDAAVGPIQQALDCLTPLKDELETLQGNLEENFSGTARYEAVEEAVNALSEVIDNLESALEGIQEISLDW